LASAWEEGEWWSGGGGPEKLNEKKQGGAAQSPSVRPGQGAGPQLARPEGPRRLQKVKTIPTSVTIKFTST
jgi:hypothetical protein